MPPISCHLLATLQMIWSFFTLWFPHHNRLVSLPQECSRWSEPSRSSSQDWFESLFRWWLGIYVLNILSIEVTLHISPSIMIYQLAVLAAMLGTTSAGKVTFTFLRLCPNCMLLKPCCIANSSHASVRHHLSPIPPLGCSVAFDSVCLDCFLWL